MMQKLTYNSKAGFNLSEIMIAVLVIAVAFLPIIAVFGTSIKATTKDDAIIRAMNLCQEKLDTAQKFPFGFFENMATDLTATTFVATNAFSLSLHNESINNVAYRYVLRVENRPGSFSVRERDLLATDTTPANWTFNATTVVNYTNLVHRYTMTVFWRGPDDTTERFYKLVTFKANLSSI